MEEDTNQKSTHQLIVEELTPKSALLRYTKDIEQTLNCPLAFFPTTPQQGQPVSLTIQIDTPPETPLSPYTKNAALSKEEERRKLLEQLIN